MAVLTAKARDKLRKSQFALPAKRRYPIHDLALARVAQYGSTYEKATVKAAVYKKYPRLKKRK